MQFESARDPSVEQPAQGQQHGSAQTDDHPVVLEVKSHIGPTREKPLDQEVGADESAHQRAQPMTRAEGDEGALVAVLIGPGIPGPRQGSGQIGGLLGCGLGPGRNGAAIRPRRLCAVTHGVDAGSGGAEAIVHDELVETTRSQAEGPVDLGRLHPGGPDNQVGRNLADAGLEAVRPHPRHARPDGEPDAARLQRPGRLVRYGLGQAPEYARRGLRNGHLQRETLGGVERRRQDRMSFQKLRGEFDPRRAGPDDGDPEQTATVIGG
uniref:Btz domain-containing protein n=1 Tax=Parastrongyloides trichosuri TaxID=131310 RepID=A0A0N4ZXW3_PARTI